MATPKVSVTVVTYNHGPWLVQCLDSILAQETNFEFEILVGDDASTDHGSRSLLAEYEANHAGRITVIQRDINIGPDNNLFDLQRRCRGDYIAHVDGDDRWLPGKLQRQADFLDANPRYSAVAHRVFFEGKSSVWRQRTRCTGDISLNSLLINGTPFVNSSKMYRRSMTYVTKRQTDVPVVDFYLHVDNALRGPIYLMPEYLGINRYACGISTDPSWCRRISLSYMEAYDYVLSNGGDPTFVLRAKERRRMSLAFSAIRANQRELCCELANRFSGSVDARGPMHVVLGLLTRSYLGYHAARLLYLSWFGLRSIVSRLIVGRGA